MDQISNRRRPKFMQKRLMKLIFNPNNCFPLPFGVTALQGVSKSVTMELGVDSKVSSISFDPLPVPTLLNEVLLLRYFARSSSSDLYAPAHQAEIDNVLDKVEAFQSSQVKVLLKQLFPSPKKFVVGDSLTIADLSVWSFLKSVQLKDPSVNLKAADQFLKTMDAIPELQDAQKIVSHLVSPSKRVEGLQLDAMAKVRYAIGQELAKITGLDATFIASQLEITKGANNTEVADLSVPVPKLKIRGNLQELAAEYASKIQTNEWISSVTAAGSHLNFKINKLKALQVLTEDIHSKGVKFGTGDSLKGQTFVVEFSSPNIAKPFHAGHLRSTIIGNFVRNIADANGAKTIAINYLGDWGKQYGLLAVGFERYGSEADLTRDPIKHLYEVYVKINKDAKEDESVHDLARAYFKRMEENDEAALALWKRFRDLSIVKYKEIYARLNISFDIYSGESQYSEGMRNAMEHLKSKNLLTESDGALVVDLKKYKLSSAVVQKADGATLYITRDIAAARERHQEYKFDKMIYVVASQQDFHFQQLFKILDLSGFEWHKKCEHINFGMVKGMSTRNATVVFLEDILDESAAVMLEKMKSNEEKAKLVANLEETANTIGLSAVVVQDMSSKRVKDYDFSWSKMTSFEGDTGPYMQYSHARLCSIERQFVNYYNNDVLKKNTGALDISYTPQLPFSLDIVSKNDSPKMRDLAFFLSQFPEIVARVPKSGYEPCNIVTYLFQICHRISSCLDDVYVMDTKNIVEDKEVLLARFWVYWSARVVLGNGMRLLGLKPLERM